MSSVLAGRQELQRKLEAVRIRSQDGEIHFILRESRIDKGFENGKDFDEARVKRIMKKEASKPLLLLREE
jgi:hypothetical protein